MPEWASAGNWRVGRLSFTVVLHSEGVRSGVRVGRPQASWKDSHRLLCRNRCLVGTEQCVRGGRDGQDRAGREAKVASEPDALVRSFGELGFPVVRIGLEA